MVLYLWQGFQVKWEHKMLNMSTPHRLGSFASYIENNVATMHFEPGGNGDWARPVTFASIVDDIEAPQTRQIETGVFVDTINEDNNTARSSHGRVAVLEKAGVVVWQGFKVTMNSDEESHVWLTDLHLSLQQTSDNQITVSAELERAWTPRSSRSLSHSIKYSVTFFYIVLFNVQTSGIFREKTKAELCDLREMSYHGHKMQPGHVAVLREFQFSLQKNNVSGHGRYFSALIVMFRALDEGVVWIIGPEAPKKTSFTTGLTSRITVQYLNLTCAGYAHATGLICVDDTAFPHLFFCEKKGIKATKCVTVPFLKI